MTGGQMMVVLIVAMVMIASIVKARYGHRHRPTEGADGLRADTRENQRLREEVTALKERLAVLERITVEKENSLEREIEQLRDR
ncbi:MAG TPA: hypothetical protein VGR19_00855 [Allosphingosinicella sp.]|nr:hypothetical protein [Allosphingosinicella sp.]